MSTATTTPTPIPSESRQQPPPEPDRLVIGPDDHGRTVALEAFGRAEFVEGWRYELARGIVVVTKVPGVPHGWIVRHVARLFDAFDQANPRLIQYLAGGGECRLRLPGMKCDRHPDQAVYLTPPPDGPEPWNRWCPDLVVEVVSPNSEDRDYVEKREEYLKAGVREYWILDPQRRRLFALLRRNDIWEERVVPETETFRSEILPGLEARAADLLGPAPEVDAQAPAPDA